jgi:hypothetical protein
MARFGREILPAALVLVGQALIVPNATSAQVIAPRTVPVQQSGQFDIFPSRLAGMAGVSIALDDTLLDPFVNPAKAVRVAGTLAFTMPGVHAVTRGGGGGQTVPLGVLASRGSWAGGGLIAGQWLTHRPLGFPNPVKETTRNGYLSALLARKVARGLSVGASGYWAKLDGMDGLDLLYTGSTKVAASGGQLDLRAGILKQWADTRALELMLVYGRSDMSHDVDFPVNSWDPTTRTFRAVARSEHNDDRLRFWGIHSELSIPLDHDGTRIGWVVTANRLAHPRIPNYPLANLPRDPGGTDAYNMGVGIGKTLGGTIIGADLVYEPIWSHTWADAASDLASNTGAIIPAGGKTVENWFRFSNVRVRGGWSYAFRSATDSMASIRLQAGFTLYSNSYRLRQLNHLAGSERHQSTGWTEWGPSLGLAYRGRLVEIAYSLQVNCSPQSCQLFGGDDVTVAPNPGTGGVIAPLGAMGGLGYGQTLTHRLTISLPGH